MYIKKKKIKKQNKKLVFHVCNHIYILPTYSSAGISSAQCGNSNRTTICQEVAIIREVIKAARRST